MYVHACTLDIVVAGLLNFDLTVYCHHIDYLSLVPWQVHKSTRIETLLSQVKKYPNFQSNF